jgi:putative PIN family toxin of toxin-antitoxin system
VRAILDPNVIISALLAPDGSPAKVLRAGLDGAYDLVASPLLLAELERALAYSKIRRRIPASDATAAVRLVERQARVVDDPTEPPLVRSPDPGDDYLIALAVAARAVIVSGDRHLLGLDQTSPIHSPAAFLALLGDGS